MAIAAKTLAETVYFFTRATLCVGDLKFGEMEFGEMKRDALSMKLNDQDP